MTNQWLAVGLFYWRVTNNKVGERSPKWWRHHFAWHRQSLDSSSISTSFCATWKNCTRSLFLSLHCDLFGCARRRGCQDETLQPSLSSPQMFFVLFFFCLPAELFCIVAVFFFFGRAGACGTCRFSHWSACFESKSDVIPPVYRCMKELKSGRFFFFFPTAKSKRGYFWIQRGKKEKNKSSAFIKGQARGLIMTPMSSQN